MRPILIILLSLPVFFAMTFRGETLYHHFPAFTAFADEYSFMFPFTDITASYRQSIKSSGGNIFVIYYDSTSNVTANNDSVHFYNVFCGDIDPSIRIFCVDVSYFYKTGNKSEIRNLIDNEIPLDNGRFELPSIVFYNDGHKILHMGGFSKEPSSIHESAGKFRNLIVKCGYLH